jgi:hypothetical protein
MLATLAPHVCHNVGTCWQGERLPQGKVDGEPAEHVGRVRGRVRVERDACSRVGMVKRWHRCLVTGMTGQDSSHVRQ